MHMHSSHTALDGGRGTLMRRDRFEVNQYVRVRVTETRFAIGIVTAIDEDRDKATVETRNGYEVTVPMSALRRAFLVVLDLNGVLVVRGRGSFILRPHVSEFLKFVFSNFVVAVWTSGLQRSSNPIIEHVFGSYRDLLLFTLFRDACVSKATVENPYGTEKNLQTIFDRYPLSFHAVNTIIIDDSPDKCSHPDIALCPIPFKDPVTQSQDEGLVETMETLREVLLLDSGVPLIHAAEARLRRMAEGEGEGEEAVAHDAAAVVQPEAHTPPSAAAPPAEPSPATAAEAPPTTEEVELWKTRLCCDHLQDRCKQGDRCPFSHDPDDGRPCSRKSNCRVHGARWPKTREEAEKEARKRQLREAKQMQYKLEQERRQLELQQQPLQQHGGRGQQRRQSDILHQLQESTAQRQRGERPRQPQRRGRHHEVWALGPDVEEDDWASATTGLSHTGDPAYDNMINEQQRQLRQQQQQRGNAAGERAATNSTAAAAHFHVEEQQLHRREERGRSGASSLNVTTTAAGLSGPTSDLSSGYRRQLQHHSQAFHSTTGSHDAYPHSYMQSTSGQSSNVTDSLAFLFPSATTTTSTAAVIEPFSTRPIAASPPAPQAAPAFHFPASQAPMMTAAHAPNRTFATTAPQPSSQQPQAIRISGSQGDSSAVVNQLQALLRGS